MIDSDFQKSISGFLVKVALPLFYFSNMSKADISFLKESLYMPLAAVLIAAAAMLISFLIFNFMPLSGKEKRAGIALSTFGNGSYLPLSLIEILPVTMPLFASTFETDKAVVFVGVFMFFYSPLLWSVGNFLITKHSRKFSIWELLSPPLYGTLLGFLIPVLGIQSFVFNPELPVLYIFNALERIGSILTPLILINLGAMIAGIEIHSSIKKQMNLVLSGVMAVRYFFLPLVFYVLYFYLLKPLDIDRSIIFVLFLQFHIPPANNLSTMAMDAGVNEDLTAYILLVTYLSFVILLPVFLLFFSKL